MQFTGHSLPVHQSMSVPWEFFTSSHFISQFPPTRFPLITAIRMCHFLPAHHLGMAFLARSKAKIQHNVFYSSEIPEVMWYESLYMFIISSEKIVSTFFCNFLQIFLSFLVRNISLIFLSSKEERRGKKDLVCFALVL